MKNQTDKIALVPADNDTRTRILVVDANPFITRMFEFVLKTLPEFMIVGIATDGLSALLLAETHHPDIILFDTDLYSAIHIIKQLHEAIPDTHIVALTGMYTTQACIFKALEAGATATLSKVGTLHDFVYWLHAVGRTYLAE